MAELRSVNGLLNLNSFLESSLSADRVPLKNLNERKSKIQKKNSVFTDLRSVLSDLRSRVKGFTSFGSETTLASKAVVSSDDAVVTAEATDVAEIGVHTLKVGRIAIRDTILSDKVDGNKTTLLKKLSKSPQSFTIKSGDKESEITFSVSEDDKTDGDLLKRLAQVINNADLDITASTINVSKKNLRLVLVSKETGSEAAIELEEDDDGKLLSQIGLVTDDDERTEATKSKGGVIQTDIELLDAQFTINGIEIEQGSNTVKDVVKGLTINLLKAQDEKDDPETLSISPNTEVLKEEITGFIKDFNEAIKFINAKTAVNTSANERESLSGNFATQQLKFKLREIVSQNIPGSNNNGINNIAEIGLEIGRDGTIKIEDEEKFEESLENNAASIQALFTNEDGIGKRLEKELTKFTRVGGIISDSQIGVNSLVKSLDVSIKRIQERIDRREISLRRQFRDLQKVLNSLALQQSIIQRTQSTFQNFNFSFQQFGGS